MTYDLRHVPLFEELPEADIARLEQGMSQRTLEAGEMLFDEGDEADNAYIIASGEIEILKESGGRQVRIAVSSDGDIVGEMGLVTGEARSAAAKDLTDVTLVELPKACLDDVLSSSVEANQALFHVFIQRWREQESRVRQSERMAQIGVLTAGLAHEMNNPAAAVTAGADRLSSSIDTLRNRALSFPPDVPVPQPSREAPPSSAVARADIEDGIEDVLTEAGIDEPWSLAPALTDAGYVPEDFEGATAEAILLAAAEAEAQTLRAEVGEGAKRLAELVAALKSYSFLDQAPVQEVDVVRGIDDTLLILKPKIKDIKIVKEYDENLEPIVAYGSQLNQVWTNLIDNAADAIHDAGVTDGRITLRARKDDDGNVVVQVENNGPPIPDHVVDRIFEAFFTTKEPGKGTGLGLDTSYSIIVSQHRGSLTVESDENATTFTAVIPSNQDPQ